MQSIMDLLFCSLSLSASPKLLLLLLFFLLLVSRSAGVATKRKKEREEEEERQKLALGGSRRKNLFFHGFYGTFLPSFFVVISLSSVCPRRPLDHHHTELS